MRFMVHCPTTSFNQKIYDDCGEINCTLLAENCCDALDGYAGVDFDIPEEYYDVAVEVTDTFED